EQAERRRADQEEREHQGSRGERLLAARQQAERLQFLARQLRHDLDPRLPAFLRLGGPELRRSAREELRKHLGEARVGRLEGVLESSARGAGELADRVPEILEGSLEVCALRRQELVPPTDLLELCERSRIDVAEPHEARPELLGVRGILLAGLWSVGRDVVQRLVTEIVALRQS